MSGRMTLSDVFERDEPLLAHLYTHLMNHYTCETCDLPPTRAPFWFTLFDPSRVSNGNYLLCLPCAAAGFALFFKVGEACTATSTS